MYNEAPLKFFIAVMSRRKKGDRIALWTSSKKNKEGNLFIWLVMARKWDRLILSGKNGFMLG